MRSGYKAYLILTVPSLIVALALFSVTLNKAKVIIDQAQAFRTSVEQTDQAYAEAAARSNAQSAERAAQAKKTAQEQAARLTELMKTVTMTAIGSAPAAPKPVPPSPAYSFARGPAPPLARAVSPKGKPYTGQLLVSWQYQDEAAPLPSAKPKARQCYGWQNVTVSARTIATPGGPMLVAEHLSPRWRPTPCK